ncbi:protein msta-like [Trichogramma pretiosum]|uniref:protein msta-like n=1 Tax=Trichogramma pretiosum TaxID=7493 RepID=UPI0006C9D762|nr:protein msta-like [Trichogramma pretiosum]
MPKSNSTSDKSKGKKYEIARSEKLGRYLIAGRDLSAGEVLFREKALAVGVAMYERAMVCFGCMRPYNHDEQSSSAAKLQCCTCSKCDLAPVCNRLCETSSESLHTSWECDFFREKAELIGGNVAELLSVLLHVRLCLLRDHQPELWRQIMAMESHLDERRGSPVWQERELGVVSILRKYGLESSSADPDELQRLCGVVDVNCFELRAPSSRPYHQQRESSQDDNCLLRGLYATASIMSHECRGTACLAADESFSMTVYTAVPLARGQVVSFNYTSSLAGTLERREHLREGKYFRCDCRVCLDPLEAGSYASCLVCPRCRRDWVAMREDTLKNDEEDPYGRGLGWQCRGCERRYAGCLIESSIVLAKRWISEVDTGSVRAMEHLLDKLSSTFHTNHYLVLSLKQKLLAAYRRDVSSSSSYYNSTSPPASRKTLRRMYALCLELLSLLEIVEPGLSRLKAILLYEMHVPLAAAATRAYGAREIGPRELLEELERARAHLRRALEMLLNEPRDTPEGQLARRGLQEMRLLQTSVEDARALVEHERMDSKDGRRKNNCNAAAAVAAAAVACGGKRKHKIVR